MKDKQYVKLDEGAISMKSIMALVSIGFFFLCLLAFGQDDMINYWMKQGSDSYHNKSLERARECFDKVIEMNPKYIDAYYMRGMSALLDPKRDPEESIRYFDKVLEMNQSDDRALSNKGLAFAYLGEIEDAMKFINKALEINPSNADAMNNKGVVYYYMNERNQAMKCFDEAILLDTRKEFLGDIYFNKAMIYQELGDLAKYNDFLALADEYGTFGSTEEP
jgi:tetratricopeptide (TPR) repeat protein